MPACAKKPHKAACAPACSTVCWCGVMRLGRAAQAVGGALQRTGAHGALALGAVLTGAAVASATTPACGCRWPWCWPSPRRPCSAVWWKRRCAPCCATRRQLAAGDLTHTVAVDAGGLPGELQGALAQLSVNLRTVIGDVTSEAENLRTAVARDCRRQPGPVVAHRSPGQQPGRNGGVDGSRSPAP